MEDSSPVEILCKEILKTAGIRLRTPKDYDTLSLLIFQKTRMNISTSTLKRLMGYLPNTHIEPRLSTLDILSRYVGYIDYEGFTNLAHQKPIKNIDMLELRRKIHTLSVQMENMATMMQHLEETLK